MDILKLYSRKVFNFDINISPRLNLLEYIDRLFKIGKFTNSEIIVSIIYIERIKSISNILTKNNINLIFALSIMISEKWLNEYDLDFNEYSKLFGISKDELISLEVKIIDILCWRLHVTKQDFDNKISDIMKNNNCSYSSSKKEFSNETINNYLISLINIKKRKNCCC